MLRPLRASHNHIYRNARNNDSVRRWCRQVGYISELQQEKWLFAQDSDPTIQMFEYVVNDAVRGVCGLTSIDMVSRRAEFSLYIIPEFCRKGFATKALLELFNFGFRELGLHQIWGETFAKNPAAQIFDKIGMQVDGIRRDFYFKDGKFIDAVMYSMLAEEWFK